MKQNKISSSQEDYLEAIAELIETKGHARAKDIAEKLHVKMPSVTNALRVLASKDLIQYQTHKPVTLTVSGLNLATRVQLRHSALKKFFHKILKLTAEESDEAACKIEHIVGEKIISRLISLTDTILEREECKDLHDILLQIFMQTEKHLDLQQNTTFDQLKIG